MPFARSYIPKGPIGNRLALVQVMALRRTGDRRPEQGMTQFADTYMRY